MKIGIITDSLRLPLYESIKTASQLGVNGIQMYAVEGDLAPWNITKSKRKLLFDYIQDLGLEVSALCGDFGGHGFQCAAENTEKIEKSKQVLCLAKDLGSNVVTTHIGIIPHDDNEVLDAMMNACQQLETIAKEHDGYFAIETGCETPEALKKFLINANLKRVCVNYDPANLVMVTNSDPVAGVNTLKDYIVHTHAKDGIFKKAVDPRLVYGYPGFKSMSHEDISKAVTRGEFFAEVPLGEGSVDFDKYVKALKAINYTGYLTIEREVNQNPIQDITLAVNFLKKILNANL